MKFNGSQAWQDAIAAISANRAVLIPVAGVFFLLPGLISAWFMSDVQMAVLENLANPEKTQRAIENISVGTWTTGFVGTMLQLTGFMALLALFRDYGRPTVGEAIGSAVKGLPTLIAATIIFFFGFVLAMGLVFGIVAALAAGAPPLGFLLALAATGVSIYIPLKLSLTLPVIVIDRVSNPFAALARSWRLTKGNALRLFGFYLLLFIGYMVTTLVAISVVGALIGVGQFTAANLVPGSVALIAMGLVSGLIGAVVSVLFSGILASIHRQLSGPSTAAIAETFL